jgi:hypothetical protein
VALAEAAAAWLLYFSWVQFFDDEGYLVTMYREWIGGGALYDDVYSQYGPFHTVVIGLPFRVLNLPFELTTGRFLTLTLLVGTAALFAVAVLALTKSILSAVLTQLLVFWAIAIALITAPLHPVSTLLFLFATLSVNLTVVRPRARVASDWMTGGLIAAVALTKINVGVFALVAMLYVVGVTWSVDRTRRWLQPLGELSLLLLGPFLLLSQRADVAASPPTVMGSNDPAILTYWGLTYVAAAACVIAFVRIGQARTDIGPSFSIGGLAGGFGAVVAATVLVVTATGTSVGSLISSVIIRPLSQPDALTALPALSAETLVLVAATAGLVAAGWALSRPPPTPLLLAGSGGLRIVAALILLIATVGPLRVTFADTMFAGSLSYLSLAALVVLPRLGGGPYDFAARSFLGALAVTHTLHAFPVAGIQMVAGLVLPTVCAVVVLDDGARELVTATSGLQRARLWRLASHGVVAVTLLWAGWQHRDHMRLWYDLYQDAEPVALPSSAWMRANTEWLAAIRPLIDEVDRCDALVSHPNFLSLNLWTEIPPPTGYNATLWADLLDDGEQQAIVDALERTRGEVCYVVRQGYERPPPTDGPLGHYLSGFEPRWTGGGHVVLVRPME